MRVKQIVLHIVDVYEIELILAHLVAVHELELVAPIRASLCHGYKASRFELSHKSG